MYPVALIIPAKVPVVHAHCEHVTPLNAPNVKVAALARSDPAMPEDPTIDLKNPAPKLEPDRMLNWNAPPPLL